MLAPRARGGHPRPQGLRCLKVRTEVHDRREAAAKQAGWTIEGDSALIVVRDVWAWNENSTASWLLATKVGLPLERVTVWAGRET
jgi:hypothetical protein